MDSEIHMTSTTSIYQESQSTENTDYQRHSGLKCGLMKNKGNKNTYYYMKIFMNVNLTFNAAHVSYNLNLTKRLCKKGHCCVIILCPEKNDMWLSHSKYSLN